MTDDAPRIHVEPPVPSPCEISGVEHVRAIVLQLYAGNFRQAALLVERMLWNPRLRAVVETRLAGLISTEIRFKPSKNNRDGRRAAREFKEDWKLIAPSPMRKQMMQWGLFLGAGFGQRMAGVSPRSGRTVYQLQPYWPGFAYWDVTKKAYKVQTEKGVVDAKAPTVTAPTDRAGSPWVIAEPFGVNSFRSAYLQAAWTPWLGHNDAQRHQNRKCEKDGVGAVVANYPRNSGSTEDKAALNRWLQGLRTMGSEGVIPCEETTDPETGTPRGYAVKPFEFNTSGSMIISDTLGANAVALAILFLGHNLTTEIKGGGSYAAAGVADYIRDDKKMDDAEAEWTYLGPQLAEPWAEANYGDPGLAPVAEYVTDSPAVNLQRAQMIQALAYAAEKLRANVPRVDLEALAEQFQLPMLLEGTQVQVPAVPEHEEDDGAQPGTPPNSETPPMPGAK